MSDSSAPPDITVCIPAFNAEDVIERAIRSAVMQEAGSIEVLVCDDGSTDRTADVVGALQAELPGVRLISNRRNRGRPYTRNHLVREARGRLLTWLDADDEKYPGMLAAQVDKLRQVEEAGGPEALAGLMVFTNYHWWRSTMSAPKLMTPVATPDPMEQLLSARFGGYLWLMLGLTDTWRAVGQFDENLPRLQDLAYLIRFAELGGRFVRADSPEPLCVYHKDDLGRDAAAVWTSWNRIWRQYRHHYNSYGLANARAWRRNHYRVARRFARSNGDEATFWRVAMWESLHITRGRFGCLLLDRRESDGVAPRDLTPPAIAVDSGAAYWCPVCRRDVVAWDPGPNGRPNEQCPHCRSLKRSRLLVLAFDRLATLLDSADVVLDVAPTPGVDVRLREHVAAHAYVSFDLGLDKRPVMVRGDLTAIPLPDDSVDVLVSFHVLEHIPDDRAAMREMRRVIGARGIAVLQVPWLPDQATEEDPSASREERIRRFGRHDHVRQYGSDFEDRLREAGLTITQFRAGSQFPADVRKRANINGLLWFATGVPADPTDPAGMIAAVLERGHQRSISPRAAQSLRQQRDAYRSELLEREFELRKVRRERNAARKAAEMAYSSRSYRVGHAAISPIRWVRRVARADERRGGG